MKNPHTKQSLAEDVKREVLMELNLGNHREHNLVDGIKREVLMELNQYHREQSPSPYANRAFIEAVKSEVLAGILGRTEQSRDVYGVPQYPSRALVEAVKREVIAQIETERESREESRSQEQKETAEQHHDATADPALVQAVKNSVLAEMNIPYYR